MTNTLFVIAQYLAWAEALRRGVQFLELGDLQRNRELVSRLEAIRSTFSTDSRVSGPFRIFRGEQRAIGELMLEPAGKDNSPDMPWQCSGYAAFCSMMKNDQDFASWFARLDGDVHSLARHAGPPYRRLAALQNDLMDLIDFVDDPPVRFPATLRSRLPRS